ncbi:hypothetical protein BGW38_001568 [Lunasporangiospora selenospora]|uniref:YitH/HolE acetyltransferase (GNAT) domain-containing protein n=1 Tax=Lunasporangiospora selenospora TaxID=979761 RepID=A0A9P6G320_9FUNG|nr:hypothetical protein BGW38_001568 [Lunasporangiospora selenospora]
MTLTESAAATASSPQDILLTAKSKVASEFVVDHVSAERARELFLGWSTTEQWNPTRGGDDVHDIFHKIDPEGFLVGSIIVSSDKTVKATRPSKIDDEDGSSSSGSSSDEEDGQTSVTIKKTSTVKKPVAIISAIRFGEDQAWIGYYIVDAKERGNGYGLKTFQAALAFLNPAKRSIGLDAVMTQVPNYEKSGFTNVGWQSERRNGTIASLLETREPTLAKTLHQGPVVYVNDTRELRVIDSGSENQVDFDTLIPFEAKYTGLRRPEFAKRWLKYHADNVHKRWITVVALSRTEKDAEGRPVVLGYGCIRPAQESYRVGPLYTESAEVAKEILIKLSVEVSEAEKISPLGVPLVIDMDIPQANAQTVAMFDSFGWKDVFPSLRMWRGPVPKHNVNGIYAVATLELG